jgi:antitoxin component YwqK of YwqJK toxin-antitoxin module
MASSARCAGADDATADWAELQKAFPPSAHLSAPLPMKDGSLQQLLGRDGDVLARITFFDDGRLRSYAPIAGGKEHGTDYEYFPGGIHEHRFEVVAGRRDGHSLEWDQDGNLIGDYSFSNGDGVRLILFKDGNVKTREEFKSGVRDGLSVSYGENGRVSDVCRYIEGHLDGPSIACHENGVARWYGFFRERKLSGPILEFDQSGKVTKVKFFLGGSEVDRGTYLTAALTSSQLPRADRDQDYVRSVVVPQDFPITAAEAFPTSK